MKGENHETDLSRSRLHQTDYRRRLSAETDSPRLITVTKKAPDAMGEPWAGRFGLVVFRYAGCTSRIGALGGIWQGLDGT